MDQGKTHYPIVMFLSVIGQAFVVVFAWSAAGATMTEPGAYTLSPATQFWTASLPAFGLVCALALYWGVAGDSSDLVCLVASAVALPVAFAGVSVAMHRLDGPGAYSGAADPPDPTEWIGYTLASLLHAGDVLDILHGYHVSFPVPRAEAALPRATQVVFNAAAGLTLGLLVVALPGVRGVGRRLEASRPVVLATGAAVLVAVGVTAGVRGWEPSDWAAWPADNLLRVLDLADAMDVYGVRLHGVAPDPWVMTLGLGLRLAVGTYVLGWLTGLRIRRLGGLGMSVPALIDEVFHGAHPWAALRVLRARRPRVLAPFAVEFAEPPSPAATADPALRRAFFDLLFLAVRDPKLHEEGLHVVPDGAVHRRYPDHTSFCMDNTYRIDLWHILSPRLDDPDEAVGAAAVRLLAGLPAGTPRDNVVVRMTGILGHPVEIGEAKLTEKSPGEGPWRQQGRATAVLAAIGPEAAAATPALLAVYRDPEAPAKLRLAAAKALKTVNPEEYARLPREKKRPD